MNLTGQGVYQRVGKTPKANRKRLPAKSKKRAAFHASDLGRDGLKYMMAVKSLPCCICGKPGPNDAHHCRDKPWADQVNPYTQEPCAGRKSGDKDTIPLCSHDCHNGGPKSYHANARAWRERNGPDFGFITQTRDTIRGL